MVAAHMDEVGFLITRSLMMVLSSSSLWVGGSRCFCPASGDPYRQRQVVGVIGAKSPHILTAEERAKPVKLKTMYIDIGSTSKEETEKAGVKQGDPAVPFSSFHICENGKSFMAKALDDRVGCALVVQLFQELQQIQHPSTFYGVMTVQEEVGRGCYHKCRCGTAGPCPLVDVSVATDTPGAEI